jgi:hypothetical protein
MQSAALCLLAGLPPGVLHQEKYIYHGTVMILAYTEVYD